MALSDVGTAEQLIEQGKAGSAVPLLDELTSAFPFYATPFVLLARAHEQTGDAEPALRAWQQAYYLLPNNSVVQEGLDRSARRLLASQERPLVFDESEDLDFDLPDRLDEAPVTEPETEDWGASGLPRALALEENLDELIARLEEARIVPRRPTDEPEFLLDDSEPDLPPIVSETLARIYETQGQHVEAARIYHLLAERHPDRAESFREKVAEMEDLARQQDE